MKAGLLFLTLVLFISGFPLAAAEGNTTSNVTCTDSDGGKDYYVKGCINNGVCDTCGLRSDVPVDGGYDLTEREYCKDEDNCVLFEVFCIESDTTYGSYGSEDYRCPNGCENGACINVTGDKCFDSDGGINYYVKGYVTYEGYVQNGELVKEYDKCAKDAGGNDVLQERYCVGDGIGMIDYPCRYGCVDGACLEAGICGNGVCDVGESWDNCPEDCEKPLCPARIDLAFNKQEYYPGDYFSVSVSIYDESGSLMPNQVFNMYNSRQGQTSIFQTGSGGIYESSSTVPSDPEYDGEWKFVASVSEEGCPYVSDGEIISFNIETKCGDGVCDDDEKELICERVCKCSGDSEPSAEYASNTGGSGASASSFQITPTGYITQYVQPSIMVTTLGGTASVQEETIVSSEPSGGGSTTSGPCECTNYCHVKCPADCTPDCGNGVCDTVVCESVGCPVPENENNCPQDCKRPVYCGSRSGDPECKCHEGYRKETFDSPCKEDETTSCVYYKCVPAYIRVALITEKKSYDVGEPVEIYTNQIDEEYMKGNQLTVSVQNPYGVVKNVELIPGCESGEVCPECSVGEYCPPCKTYNLCRFSGTFTETGSVGHYTVRAASEKSGFTVNPTYFMVYDKSLMEKYLILNDIDGFVYRDSSLNPGPEGIMGYMANYEKDGRQYSVIVGVFEGREALERYMKTTIENYRPAEKNIEGYYLYVFSSGGQKVYLWTYKSLFVGIMELRQVAATGVSDPTYSRVRETEMKEEMVTKSSGFMSGMITGMPVAATMEIRCGKDSLNPSCICGDDETKEKFTPICNAESCEKHYMCVSGEPEVLIKAYLDKYPSDLKASGTECEQKGGYCIDSQMSCKSGFLETSFACKTDSQKCCIRDVDRSDFLEIVMKLEGMRVKMDQLERKASSLSDYYSSVGDDDRSEKFSQVAGLFSDAKDMVDEIVAKIRDNLDNLESIRGEVKEDINALRTYINGILEKMVS